MASITEERLKEMEEEMNRFEEEISSVRPPMGRGGPPGMGPGGHPNKMIIGARTFSQVQAKLSHRPGDPHGMPVAESQPPGSRLPFHAGPAPPPPPPVTTDAPRKPHPVDIPLRPPPPPPLGAPPPPRPAFVPPQLRHRLPPPPPPFHPSGMPPLRPPMGGLPPRGLLPRGLPPRGLPPPPPMGGLPPPPFPGGPLPPNMPPFHHMPGAPHHHRPTPPPFPKKLVVDQPKSVYAAAPVLNIPKQTDTKKPEDSDNKTEDSVTANPKSDKPKPDSEPAAVGPGLEMNVSGPVEPEHQPTDHPGSMLAHAAGPLVSSMGLPTGDPAMDVDGETVKKEKKEKKKKYIRTAAGQQWEDNTLGDWAPDDFRIFCGDLGNEVTDEVLARFFAKYPSFQKSKVVRDKRTNKTRGYGFVSFKDPNDFARAMREMNGKYVGNRPIKLRKSAWRDRALDVVKKKEKEKKRLGFR